MSRRLLGLRARARARLRSACAWGPATGGLRHVLRDPAGPPRTPRRPEMAPGRSRVARKCASATQAGPQTRRSGSTRCPRGQR
eukprot:8353252-Pyramimonas_sp.AAC.1